MTDTASSPVIWMVEDHALLSANVSRLLHYRGQIKLTSIVRTAEEALEQLDDVPPDERPRLMIIDLSLPGMNGIELVGAVRAGYPDVLCLMLSGHRESRYVQAAKAAGARGYVFKDEAMAIIDAVQAVLNGRTYFSEDARG